MQRIESFLACLFLATITFAQSPDPTLWTEVVNPSGERTVPMIVYESDTGLLYLNALGMNQTLDTTSRTEIGGDDFGLIAISMRSSPEATETFLSGFMDGIVYSGSFVRNQIFGVGAGANFTRPAKRTDIFRFPTGLTVDDFGVVEMAVNFGTGLPGATVFGSVQFGRSILDVNGDTEFDCADADALAAEIANQNNDPQFDFDGDGFVDGNDFDLWIQRFAQFNGDLEGPYLRGDANFDQVVDVHDFNIWNQNRFTMSSSYCKGNFNLDDRIDVSDFNVWLSNKFQSSADSMVVPEPRMLLPIQFFAIMLVFFDRPRTLARTE